MDTIKLVQLNLFRKWPNFCPKFNCCVTNSSSTLSKILYLICNPPNRNKLRNIHFIITLFIGGRNEQGENRYSIFIYYFQTFTW